MKRRVASLAIALRVADATATLITAARLRRSLGFAEAAAAGAGGDPRGLALRRWIALAAELLATVPPHAGGSDAPRVFRWLRRIATSCELRRRSFRAAGPDLFEVDASRDGLEGATLAGLTIEACAFRASGLPGATFDEAIIDQCDFTGADLRASSWRGTRVIRSALGGSVLIDANLDLVELIECDLRGADLAAVRRGPFATTRAARFIDCDLRDTHWQDRLLEATSLVGCKLHGARGRPVFDGVVIERPDLSAAGDGSRLGVADDVYRLWGA